MQKVSLFFLVWHFGIIDIIWNYGELYVEPGDYFIPHPQIAEENPGNQVSDIKWLAQSHRAN